MREIPQNPSPPKKVIYINLNLSCNQIRYVAITKMAMTKKIKEDL